MPELPEVETMRRGVLSVVGHRVHDAERVPCRKKPILLRPSEQKIKSQLRGKRLDVIERIGKRLILRFDQQWLLVIEPRMTGLVLVDDVPDPNYLRFRIRFHGTSEAIWFWDRRGLGTISYYHEDEFQRQILDRLGPDALHIDAESLKRQCGQSRRAIKVALMDQAVLAGVGNIYASEALHQARIHPSYQCARLKRHHWQSLAEAIREILAEAVLHEGSTLSDGTYRASLDREGSYQNQHQVYDREGEVCLTCSRGSIRRLVQGGRSTFYCPSCQRARATSLATMLTEPSE